MSGECNENLQYSWLRKQKCRFTECPFNLIMAGFRIPGEHVYRGLVLESRVKVDTIEKIPNMAVINGDILISSYPKTGTIWSQYLGFLIENGDPDITFPIHHKVPRLEISDGTKSGLELLQDGNRPTIMASHLPSWAFQNQLEEGRLKVILVVRNPKDTLVSFYNFYRMSHNLGNFAGTWDEFFELYRKKQLIYGDYFDWYHSWIPHLRRSNLLLLRYEDMKNNMKFVVQNTAKFLGKHLEEDVIQSIVRKTSFMAMKSNTFTSYEDYPQYSKASTFLRKGEVGDWKNFFTEEQAKYVDLEYDEHMKRHGILLDFE